MYETLNKKLSSYKQIRLLSYPADSSLTPFPNLIFDKELDIFWFKCHFYLYLISINIFDSDYGLPHWSRLTHIYVDNQTIIGSDNGLSPCRRQAITWTNAEILLIGPLGTNFYEISIGIYTFSFKKINFEMSSGKWRPFGLGLNVSRANRQWVTILTNDWTIS